MILTKIDASKEFTDLKTLERKWIKNLDEATTLQKTVSYRDEINWLDHLTPTAEDSILVKKRIQACVNLSSFKDSFLDRIRHVFTTIHDNPSLWTATQIIYLSDLHEKLQKTDTRDLLLHKSHRIFRFV